jgi:DAPG hydrolase PhiG domain
MKAAPYTFTEPYDLAAWQRPMQPIPDRVEQAIAAGVQSGHDINFTDAACMLNPKADGMEDAVVRNSDSTLTVCCRTDMPGVTPEMWDWWFGWMGGSTVRYKLWHPVAHLKSAVERNQSQALNDRARYIGNTHLVDEYIGTEIHKLRIAFVPPPSIGLEQAHVDALGTAICARGGLGDKPLWVSHLIHLVRRTPKGAEMLSRFYLGHVRAEVPVLGRVMSWVANRPAARLQAVSDAFGLDLLRHCSEEMNHLARMLPELHAQFGTGEPMV